MRVRNRLWNVVAGGLLLTTLAIAIGGAAGFAFGKISFTDFIQAMMPVFTFWAGMFTNITQDEAPDA